jgi:hypothetical protein
MDCNPIPEMTSEEMIQTLTRARYTVEDYELLLAAASQLVSALICVLILLSGPDLSLFPFFFAKISIAHASLYHTGSLESSELVQVIGYSGENHLDIDPLNCGYKHMSHLEDRFNNSKWPFAGCSYHANL